MKTAHILGVLASALIASCARTRDGAPVKAQEAGKIDMGNPRESPLLTRDFGYSGGDADEAQDVYVWMDSDDAQCFSLHNWREIKIVDSWLDEAGSWSSSTTHHTLAFDVSAFGWRKKDVFVFAGTADNGDQAIERWEMRSARQPGSETKVPVRAEIYRGQGIGSPVAIHMDPEGRFILLLAGSGPSTQVVTFANQANATPTVLYSQGTGMPLDQMLFIRRYQHNSLGRVWVLTGMGGGLDMPAILLVDAANDGTFDYTIVDSEVGLFSSGVIGPDTVLENYDRD